METKNVVIISRNDFPEGDAGSVRDFSFAKIYEEMGYNAFCICLGHSASGFFKKVKFVSIRIEKNSFYKKMVSEFGFKSRMKIVLNDFVRNYGDIDLIHVVDLPINAMIFIKYYARHNQILIVHDSVEWYSSTNFKYGKFSYGYISKTILNRYIIDKQFKVYAISKYLQSYYSNRKIECIRIPVILCVESFPKTSYIMNKKKQFVYSGSPGRKDNLKEILHGFALLQVDYLKKLNLNIIGLNKEQLLEIPGLQLSDIEILGDSLVVFGRVSRIEVLKILRTMDFSLLLRPAKERYAKAGFPTKIVESLANSVPVICNISSDLGDYLKDMENSIIVSECDPLAIVETIKRAMNISNTELCSLRNNARKTAVKYFNYQIYKDNVTELITKKVKGIVL